MNYFEPHLTPDELRAISAIGLAHMGDAVYETLVRTWLCVHGKATGKELHRATIALVCAQKQAELAHAGLMNYLGEQYDAESGRTVEVYGRKLKMASSLDVYAPRHKGARGCEQTAEAVSEALLDGLADGLTLDELSWEKTEWDEEYGMFVRRGTARCTAYFVATADEESAVLTDFILKGVMQ